MRRTSPIALFVYARPWHTRQTLDALRRNELADESDLFIYSDAARGIDDFAAVDAVRQSLKEVNGFRSVTVVERSTNFGLARSIIEGVTQLCANYGQVIVLEDDLVTSPYFLSFMNDALDTYRDDPEVMHISGYSYPIDIDGHAESYFLRLPMCWGWATWQSSWQHFIKDGSDITDAEVKYINFDGVHDFAQQHELNRRGKIDTWFIFWYISVLRNKGVSLFPHRSLVKNIGLDASGTHRTKTKAYDLAVFDRPVKISRITIMEEASVIRAYKMID